MSRWCLVSALLAVASARDVPRNQVDRVEGGDGAELPQPRFFTQKQDHFDDESSATWQQAYYVNDTFFDASSAESATVFVCVGGEGPPLDGSVVVASVHCNVAVEWLQETGAIMFAVEHRYYGCHNASACPVQNLSAPGALDFLSSRQALADLAEFHAFATEVYQLPAGKKTKWVSWGGSYPGMLAGWFRLKYPELVHAAVASSAPVRAQVDMVGYFDVFSQSFNKSSAGGSPECLDTIASAHAEVGKMMAGSALQRDALASLFGVQQGGAAFESEDFQRSFAGYGIVPFPGQGNDPACEESFCNIQKVCSFLVKTAPAGDPVHKMAALYKAMQDADDVFRAAVAAGHDRAGLSAEAGPPQARHGGMDEHPWYRHRRLLRSGLLAGGRREAAVAGEAGEPDYWSYQTCHEFAFYQTCEVGSGCMFTQGLVTLEVASAFCAPQFGVPMKQVYKNVDATNAYYGADHPVNGSRVLWPNGEIDPWHANGVLSPPSADQPTLWVTGASHHFWTHPSLPTDSAEVDAARTAIRKQVAAWLAEP